MQKQKITILLITIIGTFFWLVLAPVPVLANSPIKNVQKCLTENYGGTTGNELEAILENQTTDHPRVVNILKYVIQRAVNENVAPTTILILFTLPLVGTLSDIMHYIIGLKGYGIYMPTMITAALWSLGISGGLILFLFILSLSLVARNLLYKVKLHYWPRRSISLWIVVFGVFLLLGLGSNYLFPVPGYVTAFSVLFLILLSEEHISVQRRKGLRVSLRRTGITLFLAVVSTLLLSWHTFQRLVLLHPEPVMLFVLGLGFIVGRYTGFRLLEFHRFSSAIRKDEEEE